MQSTLAPTLLLAAIVAAAVGAGTGYVVATRGEPNVADAAPARPDGSAQVAALERQVEQLDRKLDELTRLARTTPAAETRVAIDDSAIESAVARWMQEHRPAAAAPADEVSPTAAAAARDGELARALERLLDPALSDAERQRLWQQFAKEGLVDSLLAEFERRAELDPSNPELQVDLGEAYLQKLFTVGAGPEQGLWATKADGAFDAALALDENHWEARFDKAVSLSFWPPVFGKSKEAITHFEALLAQQSTQPKQDRFAQTHLLLGNMYLQVGDKDKALATWQNGLSQFPNDEALKKQIALAQGQ